MAVLTRLDPFVERVLAGQTPEGEPDTLKVLLPVTTVPGQPCAATVVALCARSAPTLSCDWTVEIDCPEAGLEPLSVSFVPGQVAQCRLEGLVFPAPGAYRLRVQGAPGAVVSTATVCRADAPFQIFWGDPHVHTHLSRCHTEKCRSLNFAYFAGRYLSALDWMACADHVSNGRCDLSKWLEEVAVSGHHHEPPHFVTLPAYEASLKGMCGGDNNIYMRRWPDLFVDHYEEGTVKTLLDELAERLPREDAFAVPHHTTRTGKHGEIPPAIYPGPEQMPVVEISSCWGNSEYRGNPDPLASIHEGPCTVVDLLNQGYPLGFVGGTDTHVSMPFQFDFRPGGNLQSDPGGTGIYAQALTRNSIYDGMRQRACYAGKRERSYLHATVAGHASGQQAAWPDRMRERSVAIEAAGPGPIESIEVVRNGETIHAEAGRDWHQEVVYTDADDLGDCLLESPIIGPMTYYYVRVRYADQTLAWSSPVWLTP